jgi:hypothetical protein
MMMFKFFIAFVALLVILFPRKGETKIPVSYGGDEEVDACMTFAQVNNLGTGSDAFLAVKDEPNLKADRIDKILSGKRVWICEESKDGKWFGVVYPVDEKDDCGVTKSVKDRGPYLGPCKSGWISKKYVTVVAG